MNDSLGLLAHVSESSGRVCVVLKQRSTLLCHFIFEFSYCYHLKQRVSGTGWHEIAFQRHVSSRKSHMTLTEESLRRHRASCHRQHDGAFRGEKVHFQFPKKELHWMGFLEERAFKSARTKRASYFHGFPSEWWAGFPRDLLWLVFLLRHRL